MQLALTAKWPLFNKENGSWSLSLSFWSFLLNDSLQVYILEIVEWSEKDFPFLRGLWPFLLIFVTFRKTFFFKTSITFYDRFQTFQVTPRTQENTSVRSCSRLDGGKPQEHCGVAGIKEWNNGSTKLHGDGGVLGGSHVQ